MTHHRPSPTGRTGACDRADVPALGNARQRVREQPGHVVDAPRRLDPRPGKLQRGFTDYLRHIWLPRGECWTTEASTAPRCGCRPDAGRCRSACSCGCSPACSPTARLEAVRLMRYLTLVEGKHPHKPHWYLAVLGVDPGRQGRGFGSHLMQPVLERCDAERRRRLSGDRHREKRAAVRAPRLQGHRGVPAAGRRASHLADVARAARS